MRRPLQSDDRCLPVGRVDFCLWLVMLTGLPFAGICRGEVSFDGSIGGPAGTLSGPNFMIPSNRGEIAGANLFHSFAAFNLATGESATFSGPANIGNILARVTGGASTINGEIRSDVAGANLYLINQAGIMFGNGSKVNVSGAFHATTADYVRFEDGRQFSASPGGEVTMLVARPEAFGFLDGGLVGGDIDVEIGFANTMASAARVHFIGRNVELRSSLIALPGREIGIAATGAGAAEVGIDPGSGSLLSSTNLTGDVTLRSANLNVSGANDGRIIIQGGELVIAGASELIGDSFGLGNGGLIEVETSGDFVLEENSRVRSFSRNSLDGGLISIRSGGRVSLRDGGEITASAISSGAGGSIRIEAAELSIDGLDATTSTRLSAQSNPSATGAGGNIQVKTAGEVEILNGGQVVTNTFGAGNAGTVDLRAGSLFMDGGSTPIPTSIAASSLQGSSSTPSHGVGGNITIDVAGLAEIRNRASVEATTGTEAHAGSIHFSAGDLFITGARPGGLQNEFLTGILGLTTLSGVSGDGSSLLGGRGGSLFVDVLREIRLVQGGQIDTSSFGGGAAGSVEVRAGSILADRAGSDFFTGIGSDTEAYDDRDRSTPIWGGPGGRAGDVTVSASKSIVLLNGANISSSSAGSGDAGDVSVFAPQISISGLGSDRVFTPGPESGIVALTEGGDLDNPEDPLNPVPPATGSAGSVMVSTARLDVFDGGKVSAEALGSGAAGGVTVNAVGGSVSLATDGRISARSELQGNAGQVVITADQIMIGSAGTVESLSLGTGEAGGVRFLASDIELNKGTISTVAAQANAGDISLEAARDLLLEKGSVSASAGADGGSIILTGGRYVFADQSRVEAEAQGNGGNILINDATYFLSDRSLFNASAIRGNGGSIAISTGVFLENLSVFDVSSEFGASGVVEITPLNSLSGSEGEVEITPLDATDQLQPECTQRLATKSGSFIRAGRGGSPRLPGGYLPSVRLTRSVPGE
jgi:filamentous hemagglutinin family protein